MRKDTRTKIKIKKILLDKKNWIRFKTDYLPKKVPKDMIADIIEQVEKMLGFGMRIIRSRSVKKLLFQ